MTFREFDLPKAQRDVGLTPNTTRALFAAVLPVPASESLVRFWEDYRSTRSTAVSPPGRVGSFCA